MTRRQQRDGLLAALGAHDASDGPCGGPRIRMPALPRTLRDRLKDPANWPWLRALEAQARQGEASALGQLGYQLADEMGLLRPHPTLSFAYAHAYAAAGSCIGLVNLGEAYLDGTRGRAKDEARGAALLARAVALGEPYAMGVLGGCYLRGRGVRRDAVRGVRLVRQGARAGDLWAAEDLAELHRVGRVVPKSRRSRMHWLRVTASNFPNCAYDLAVEYERPSDGSRPQPKRAFQIMKRPARERHAPAMHALGWYYDHGFGVRANRRAAIHWYTYSAAAGWYPINAAASMYNLWGIHSERSDAESVRLAALWLARAAAGGHEGAQHQILRVRAKARR